MIKLPFLAKKKAPISRANFFALSSAEKKKLILCSVRESAKMQEELIAQYWKVQTP